MPTDTLHIPSDAANMPVSILDTDLYKVSTQCLGPDETDAAQLTMQNAVLQWFPDAHVKIRFTNRSPEQRFSRKSFEWIQDRVNSQQPCGMSD